VLLPNRQSAQEFYDALFFADQSFHTKSLQLKFSRLIESEYHDGCFRQFPFHFGNMNCSWEEAIHSRLAMICKWHHGLCFAEDRCPLLFLTVKRR